MADNIDIVRRSFALWNEGKVDSPEFRALLADDVVVEHPPGWPEPGPSVGRDAVLTQYMTVRDTFAGDRIEMSDPRAAADRVICRMQWEAIGGSSGVDAQAAMYPVYTFADGRLTHLAFYWSEDEALKAFERG